MAVKGTVFKWHGPQISRKVVRRAKRAMADIALAGEKGAKAHLYPGHGYDTGSLKRSIHVAKPGYNWESDHSYPNGPERGGQRVMPGEDMELTIGSGQDYAHWVILRWGYDFMQAGMTAARNASGGAIDKHFGDMQ